MASPESNYSQAAFLTVEEHFSERDVVEFLIRTSPVTWVISAIYVAAIFGLQRYMRHRPPLNLRPALVAWSAFLAVFSIIGACRLIPERFHAVQNYGWTFSVCTMELHSGPVGFWTFLFVLSKILELGDTLFIILRKQKLIFLHWYHHIIVLIFAFYTPAWEQPFGRWFSTINYFVHAVMYSYYTLKAARIRVPKPIAMVITVLQITQVRL